MWLKEGVNSFVVNGINNLAVKLWSKILLYCKQTGLQDGDTHLGAALMWHQEIKWWKTCQVWGVLTLTTHCTLIYSISQHTD